MPRQPEEEEPSRGIGRQATGRRQSHGIGALAPPRRANIPTEPPNVYVPPPARSSEDYGAPPVAEEEPPEDDDVFDEPPNNKTTELSLEAQQTKEAEDQSFNLFAPKKEYGSSPPQDTAASNKPWNQVEEGNAPTSGQPYGFYKEEPSFCEKYKWPMIICGILVAVGVAVGVAVPLTQNNDSESQAAVTGVVGGGGPPTSSVFIMTNAESGNEILMYDRNRTSGLLTHIGCFPTGGVGAALGAEPLGMPLVPPDDPLASQDSLIVTESLNCLLAVNAGSDTVTSFSIESHGLWNMGQQDSGGDLPVSIAEHAGLVYVLNAGGEGSITGFNIDDNCVMEPIANSTKSLGQTGTTDPPFFVASPAQIGFSPDGLLLIVTIKGVNGEAGPGTILIYQVNAEGELGEPVSTTAPGNTPFSFDFDSDGNLLVVEAFGTSDIETPDAGAISLFQVDDEGFLTATSESVPTGQTTTCWLRYFGGCALTTNNGGNSISAFSVSGGDLTLLNGGSEPELNAPIDASFSADGAFFYALSTGHTLPESDPNLGQPAIYVYNVNGCDPQQIQTISDGIPTEFETVFGAVGLAILSTDDGEATDTATAPTDVPAPTDAPAPTDDLGSNVFVMTNAQSGNEIVMFEIDADSGTLTHIGTFPTGGIGAALGAVPTGSPLVPPDDPLASQDSLVAVGDGCLIAVNAGSDTVTSFVVESHGLSNMGTQASGGDLPVSIAELDGVVYVLNAGGEGSISGFNLDASCVLTPIDGTTISLGQTGADDPPFFVASPAQVGFTPDGQFLVVTIKGIGGEAGPGTISLYPVEDGGQLGTPVVTTTTGNTPFSFDFDSDGNLIIVEAFGTSAIETPDAGAVSLFEIDTAGALTVSDGGVSVATGQTTTCWLRYFEGCALTTNNGGNSISAFSVSDGALTLLNGGSEPSLNAPIDASFSANGQFFYALSTGHTLPDDDPNLGQPAIYVYSVDDCSLTEVQTISDGIPSEFETIFGAVGLAIMTRVEKEAAATEGSLAFAMTNAQSGNEVVMYGRDDASGELDLIGSFPTGGIGAALGAVPTGSPLVPPDDPLASQDALIVAGGNCLIGVNAGSDTVTSFTIETSGLWNHGAVDSGGDLPVSIAELDGVVYVLNAGGEGSISGFNLDASCVLTPIDGTTISLGQTGADDPPFFVASPAQVGFTPDGQFLVVTIKGIGGEAGPGTISLYPVEDGGQLGSPVVTTTTGNTPFSFDFDSDGNLIIVEAFGTSAIETPDAGAVSLFEIDTGGALTVSDGGVSVATGQTTTCWLRYFQGCALTTNNGGNSISAFNVSDGALTLLNGGSEPSLNAPIDASFSADGQFFYAISTGHTLPDGDPGLGQPTIYVYSVSDCNLTEVQTISDGLPTEFVTIFGVVGLALF